MAAYNDDQFESQGNPFGSLIKTSLGLAPLGAAGYVMAKRIAANKAINPAVPFGIGVGNIPAVGSAIGKELGAHMRDSHTADMGRLKELTDQIMGSKSVDKMFSAVAEQNALVQSLLDTLDDPTNELAQSSLLGYKEKLINLAKDSTNPEELQNTIKTVVKAVTEQTPESTKLRWMRNLREYQKLGGLLTPPGMAMDAGQSYSTLDPTSLRGAAKKRYKRLFSDLGLSSGQVRVTQAAFGGAQQTMAQVFSPGKQGRYLYSLPLDVQAGAGGITPFFANEGATTVYGMPKHFIDAQKAAELVKGGGALNLGTMTSQAGMSLEDFFFEEAKRRHGRTPMTGTEAKNFRAWQRQFGTVLPRSLYSMDQGALGQHLANVHGGAGNFATLVNFGNMARGAPQQLMATLGTLPGFGANAPGYQTIIRGLDQETIGRIGVEANSPITAIQSTGKASRSYFPVESRIEQVWGREAFFVSKKHRTMGRGGTLTAGATHGVSAGTVSRIGQNIDWADSLTGATNKAVLMDVAGSVYNELEGQGVALGRGRDKVWSFFSKPILDPGSRGTMQSKLFEELAARGAGGKPVNLSRDEIRKYGSFLGFGPNGLQYLRDDPRMKDMQLAFNVTESGGKKQINVMGRELRSMETWKAFGTLHKGNIQASTASQWHRVAKRMGFNRKQLKALGLSTDNTLIAAGDMLKKGAGFFDLQMRSGYALVAQDKNWDARLRKMAGVERFGLGSHELGRTTGAVVQALADRVKAGVVSPEEAGHVLAAVYTRGHSGSVKGSRGLKGWIGGVDAPQAIDRRTLRSAMLQAFGKEHYARVIGTARTGAAIGAASFVQGSGVGDYGLGRGSVEPRFIYNLQHRLKNMGFNVDEASSIISSVYKNKLGGQAALKSAGGLVSMAESLIGAQGLTEGMSQFASGVPTYNLKDLAKLSSQDFNELMSTHEKGMVLDLTSGADDVATRAIASNANDVFRQGKIFLPGRDVIDSMRDTFIRTAQDQDVLLHGDYSRLVGGFIKDLAGTTSQTASAGTASAAIMKSFKKNALDLTASAVHGVAAGKIRGMQSMNALMYSLDSDVLFSSSSKMALARNIMKRTHGQAAFMDSNAFLSQLNDFMGSRDNVQVVHEAARKAERFYLGMDEAIATGKSRAAKGIVNIGTRHPELSLGNIVPLQVFRHLDDTQEYLGTFLDTAEGAAWRSRGVNSWSSVRKLAANDRHGFFSDFVKNVSALAPEGGGTLYLPKTMATVHYGGGKTAKVDMGVAAAAIGDFDGDQWMMMMTNEKTGKQLMSTLKGDKKDQWLRSDAEYKIKSHLFAEEAKKSLAGLMGDELDDQFFASSRRVREGILKEDAAKSAVGSLDTRLNRLRMAVLDLKAQGKGAAQVDDALALLKVVQEHAVIKGKKLPVYMPFAENLTAAIDRATTTGDMGAVMNVFQNQLFAGSDLWNGMAVTGVDSPFAYARSVTGVNLNLKETMNFIGDAVQAGRVTGIFDRPTANWMAMGFNSDNIEESAKAMGMITGGQTLQGAMLANSVMERGKKMVAGAGAMLDRVGSSMNMMDRKLLGIGAVGVAASLGAMALVGHQGYAAEPMMMPGEVTSPDVKMAIGAGNLFGSRGSDGYATEGRQINTPETYMNAPNAYQMRGKVASMRQLGAVNDYLGSYSSIPNRGSIRINDTRMPITQNYADRIAGEY